MQILVTSSAYNIKLSLLKNELRKLPRFPSHNNRYPTQAHLHIDSRKQANQTMGNLLGFLFLN